MKKLRNFIRSLFIKINSKPLLAGFFVFLFFFLMNSMVYFTVDDVSSYDDQWFHFKFAYLLRTDGWNVVKNFNWLYFTNIVQDHLNYGVTLYHFFLVPFTFFNDKIFGMKLAGTVLASIVPGIIFYVIKKFEVKKAFLWVLFFYIFSTYSFVWRLMINRNFILIDGLILLEIYFIHRRKYWPLFITAIMHTWWHPGTFWVVPFMAMIYELIKYINIREFKYKTLVAGISGSISGFMLFPPHSDHLFSSMNPVSWLETLVSFFYSIKEGIGVRQGVEAYNKDFLSLVANNYLLFFSLLFIIIFSVYAYIFKKRANKDPDNKIERVVLRESLFLISIIFFLGVILISTRFEDLLMPIVFLEVILILQFIKENKLIVINNEIFKKTFVLSLAIFSFYIFVNRFLDIRNSYGNGEKYLKYEKSTAWLKANTKKGEIIFNTNWSSFPPLFFYDDWNYYTIGIEPKSLYRYNEGLYWLWHNIAYNGTICKNGDCSEEISNLLKDKSEEEKNSIYVKNARNIHTVIKERFLSNYVFFDENNFLKKELDKDPEDYELVYNNEQDNVYIYQLR